MIQVLWESIWYKYITLFPCCQNIYKTITIIEKDIFTSTLGKKKARPGVCCLFGRKHLSQ